MAQRRNRRAGVEDLWTKRDGTPSARHGKGMRWRARYVDNLGKEHSKAFTRKVDAQSWLDGQTTALGTGTHIDPHLKITVAKLADRYKSSLGHLTDKSRYTRMSALNSRVIPRWGDVLIREILPSDVGSWITEMANEGLAAQTMSFYVGTLRQLLDVAVKDRQLAVNPAANAKVPKGGKRRAPHFLTAAQVHALAEASGRAKLQRSLLPMLTLIGGVFACRNHMKPRLDGCNSNPRRPARFGMFPRRARL